MGDKRQLLLRIDDRDPSITYSNNNWRLGGNGNEYLGTTTRTIKPEASMRIPFIGTKIMLFGTIDSTAFGKSPVSRFSIDDDPSHWVFVQKQTDVSQYQQKFFESPELLSGPHVLVVTVSSVPSVRAHFTFDYAEYYTSDVATSFPSPFATSIVHSAEQKPTQLSPVATASGSMESLEIPVSKRDFYNKMGVQHVIKMNDKDPAISYSAGAWSFRGNRNGYQGTTKRTNKLGASITIPFTGTNIMLFGTIDSAALGTSPITTFTIDDGPVKQVILRQTDFTQYQQKLYESLNLAPGPHVLRVVIVNAPSGRAHFTFDYVKFYPSDTMLSPPISTTIATKEVPTHTLHSKASSVSGSSNTIELSGIAGTKCETYKQIEVQHVIKIDDRNPIISYSPDCWSLGGNQNEYLGTTSRTHTVGASMRIPFTGTKIIVFGTIDALSFGKSPVSLFSIDNGCGHEFVQKQTDVFQYHQKFYESPDLTPGPHVLAVMISYAPSSRAHFTFDYAEYYPSDIAAVSISPSATGSVHSVPISFEPALASEARTPAIDNGMDIENSTSNIIGGVLGSVAVLVAAGAILRLYLARRQRATAAHQERHSTVAEGSLTSGSDVSAEKEAQIVDSSSTAVGTKGRMEPSSHSPRLSSSSLSASYSSVSSLSTLSSGRNSPTDWCMISDETDYEPPAITSGDSQEVTLPLSSFTSGVFTVG